MASTLPLEIGPLAPGRVAALVPLWHAYVRGDDGSPPDGERAWEVLGALLASPVAHIWLAGRAGRPLGFMCWAWTFSPSRGVPVLRVLALYTAPEARRQGVARALLSEAERLARAAGANRLELETSGDNAAARRLYADLGFAEMPDKRVCMRFL